MKKKPCHQPQSGLAPEGEASRQFEKDKEVRVATRHDKLVCVVKVAAEEEETS